MKGFIFILIFLNCLNLLSAQTTRQKKMADSTYIAALKEADNSFQSGVYEKCISDLQRLLGLTGLSKTQIEHALELEAKACIEIGNSEEADELIRSLLRNNPHYELKEAENSEGFNRVVKKYQVHPLFSIGIRNTANWNWFPTTKVYTLPDGMNYNSPYNGPKGFGFFYYGWMEYEFIKSVSINLEWIFFNTSYFRNLNNDQGMSLYYSESFTFTEVPVSIRKYFQLPKNFISYASLGVSYLKMTKALGSASLTKNNTTNFSGNVDMRPMRNLISWQFTIGAGIGYQIKNLRLFLDARYLGGLNSLSNGSERAQNSFLMKDFYYIDNSFKLNQFELGASVSYTLFNSIKKISH